MYQYPISFDVLSDENFGGIHYSFYNCLERLSHFRTKRLEEDTTRLFGLELEYALYGDIFVLKKEWEKEVLGFVKGKLQLLKKTAICKSDCSVLEVTPYLGRHLGYAARERQSLEFVTLPNTLADYKKLFKNNFFEGVNETLEGIQMYTHELTGMHVHVNKNSLSNDDVAKLVFFFAELSHGSRDNWYVIQATGRDSTTHEYASNESLGTDAQKRWVGSVMMPVVEGKKLVYNSEWGGTRYVPVNTHGSTTVEFRCFQSPATLEQLFSRLEWLNNLIDFVQQAEFENVNVSALQQFIEQRELVCV
jgi:hypothetical protein